MGEATARVLARGGGNSYEVEPPTCHLLGTSFFERAFFIGATAGAGGALFSPGRREADPPGARPLFRADGSAWRPALRGRTFRDQLSRKREGPLGGQPKLVLRFRTGLARRHPRYLHGATGPAIPFRKRFDRDDAIRVFDGRPRDSDVQSLRGFDGRGRADLHPEARRHARGILRPLERLF